MSDATTQHQYLGLFEASPTAAEETRQRLHQLELERLELELKETGPAWREEAKVLIDRAYANAEAPVSTKENA